MSQNIRATPASSGRHGSCTNVEGSGWAIMSDSSIALKPVIEEPSNPIPPSNASASSVVLTENAFSWPRMSVNHSRTNRILCSATCASTSSAVSGCSLIARERYLSPTTRAARSAQPPSQRLAQRSISLSAGSSSEPISDSS